MEQVIPLLIKKTSKTIKIENTTKYLYTCFDGGWETHFRYAENDIDAKDKFSTLINPNHNFKIEFVDPDIRILLDDDLTLLKLKK